MKTLTGPKLGYVVRELEKLCGKLEVVQSKVPESESDIRYQLGVIKATLIDAVRTCERRIKDRPNL
jgi:hypothetical protein